MDYLYEDFPPQLQHLQATLIRALPFVSTLHAYALHASAFYYNYLYPTLFPAYTLARALIRRTILPGATQLLLYLSPATANYVNNSNNGAGDHLPPPSLPSLPTLVLLAVTFLVSLKALDVLRRTVLFWVGLALRLLLWGSVAFVGLYVYARGVEDSIADVGYLVGLFQGLGEVGEKRGAVRGWRREERARVVTQRGW